jgi:hypothetical protein
MPLKTTLTRYEMQDVVIAGYATIGGMKNRYGFKGLRHIARQARFGRYVINGVHADPAPHNNADADIRLAKRLEKMPPNTRVVCKTAPPRRGSPGRRALAVSNHRVRPADGKASNKHGVFDLFLDDPEGFGPKTAHEKYPAVDLQTIISWESHWRNWKRNTFTGTDGFPRGSADTPEKIARIRDAIKRARRARGSGNGASRTQRNVAPENNFAGELRADGNYKEGAVSHVLVNRFERDLRARAACLNEFGYACQICRIDFGKRYGDIGDRFIHVHHRWPLALRRTEYILNPTVDLVPVCPNCHAMLHTSNPPLEIDELRGIIQKQRRSRNP